MNLSLDLDSPVPPYEQIRGQVTSMVRLGFLPRGARLPSIRQLANDLGLAGGTVARAYRELEADGVVEARGRHGTVISSRAPSSPAMASALERAAQAYAAEAQHLGASEDDTVAALRMAYADLTMEGAP